MNLLNRLREEFGNPNSQDAAAHHVTVVQPQHQDFAEEAARAAQRYIDQIATIEQLTSDVETWRNSTTLAEAEIRRLEQREAELQQLITERDAELDKYKQAVAVLAAQFTAAAKILADGFAVIDGIEGLRVKIDWRSAGPTGARGVECEGALGLPGFIRQGPATDAERERGG